MASATASLLQIRPHEVFPEGSNAPSAGSYGLIGVSTGFAGVGFNAGQAAGFGYIGRIPTLYTATTGLTFVLALAEDPLNPPTTSGKAAVFEITTKALATGTDILTWTTAGTATTGTVTMPTTAANSVFKTLSIAIVAANLGGVVADGWCAIRVRRLGNNASDTHTGRIVLLNVDVRDT